ncbi:MAG: AMP-dependent synthetase [Actinobacteria bacterium]|nr:MAG: AMP-dependent synthetase [Actinomycetota bacterium]
MNFARDVVDSAPRARTALVALAADGSRREIEFGEVSDRSARLAGWLLARGIGPGHVVITVIGNRPEWVYAMVACFRIGAVALPCTEQLRAADLAMRIERVDPRIVLCDERDVEEVKRSGFDGPVAAVPDERLFDADPAPAAELAPTDPALITFTSGTAGEPKPIRHGQRYLDGQRVQAEHWFGARPDDLCWCTAASGWSKSARNVFIAPWLREAAALLNDARFDPEQRLEIVERERVTVLCMAPTEYRAVAKRAELRPLPSLRHAVAAGEPLNPEIVHLWRDATGLEVHDGYGQTETGALTGMPIGPPVRPGSMGLPLPGFRLWVEDDELCVDPSTVPTFFLDGGPGTWRTGDRVRQDEDGYLWFEGRSDDVIISAGYRIGPFEVESALVSHPAVAEAAAVAAPDEERGSVVRAVVVLREGHEPTQALVRELQEHARAQTAPYKYPRIVDFTDALPKTASGKIRRALLRGSG